VLNEIQFHFYIPSTEFDGLIIGQDLQFDNSLPWGCLTSIIFSAQNRILAPKISVSEKISKNINN